MFPFRRTDKLVQEVEKTGNLYFLFNALIGAYNRRTDVLAKGANGDDSTKLDSIIEMLRGLAHLPADISLIKEKLDLIHGLLTSPQPKPLEVRFVFKVANDHQDEPFSISIGGVTDAEGEALPSTDGLTVDVKSSDDAVVAVSFDPASKSGVASFGRSGVASLMASVTNAAGDILGSGAADFTVTTGDPAAVSDVRIAFSGINEEAPAPEPAPEGGGTEGGGGA
jgi:hypothetical protein